MEVVVCRACKNLFHYIAGPRLCAACQKKEEEKFKAVKDYLVRYPGASLPQLSEATGVSRQLILKFLRQDRLKVSDESDIKLECERCGKKIASGKRCKECEMELLQALKQMKASFANKPIEEVKEKSPARMRFLNSDESKYKRE